MANIGRRPQPEAVRSLVFTGLTQVNREGAYANLRLPELLSNSSLDERNRALATEMLYGTLRMQGKHDALIKRHIDRPFEAVDAGIIDLLRMGIHQVKEMRIPDHAAVGETVEVARATVGESKASFVNAILRKATSDTSFESNIDAITDPKSRLAIKNSHPEWIVSAFYDALRNWDRVESLLVSNNTPVKPHLIAWPGRSEVSELLAEGGEVLDWTTHGVLSVKMPGLYTAIRERRAGVQDRGSQLVSEIFLRTAEMDSHSLSWLDMCAGPGGKAAAVYHSLAQLRPEDEFTANEPSQHRAELVSHVIPPKRVIIHSGQELVNESARYDRIIVDAPCTGLGALRRRPEARWRKTPNDLKELVKIQRELLAAAQSILNPGGYIAYVTCSPHIQETRAQSLEFAHRFPNMSQVHIQQFLPDSVPTSIVDVDGNMQLWTDTDDSDAMYMAIFQKNLATE